MVLSCILQIFKFVKGNLKFLTDGKISLIFHFLFEQLLMLKDTNLENSHNYLIFLLDQLEN